MVLPFLFHTSINNHQILGHPPIVDKVKAFYSLCGRQDLEKKEDFLLQSLSKHFTK